MCMLLANLAITTVPAASELPEGELLSPLDLLSMMLTLLLHLVEWLSPYSNLSPMCIIIIDPKLFSDSVVLPNGEHDVQCVEATYRWPPVS